MWHSTGANNPNLKRYVQPDDGRLGTNKNGNHWNQSKPGGRSVCVHAFIGLDKNSEVATYQTLPWNIRGWHAGSTAGNDKYIAFEICEDSLVDKEYFNKVYKEACELTAYLCKKFKWDPMEDGVVICHSEGYRRGVASNHADVMHWFSKHGKTMDDVRKDVKALMQPKKAASKAKYLYRVQCGAFAKKSNATALRKKIMNKMLTTDCLVVKSGLFYKVQLGAFSKKDNATALQKKLKTAGFSAIVVKNKVKE